MQSHQSIIPPEVAAKTGRLLLLGFALLLPAIKAKSDLIPVSAWRHSESGGKHLQGLCDNDAETPVILKGNALEPLSVTVSLKQPYYIHRIFLTCGKPASNKSVPETAADDLDDLLGDDGEKAPVTYPKTLRIYVGDSATTKHLIAEAQIPDGNVPDVRFTIDSKFQPVKGSYVRLEVGNVGSGLVWNISELEIYGFDAARSPQDAVVLPDKPTPQMKIGAEDLSYYLSELTGRPVPIIKSSETDGFKGILYCFDLLDGGKDYHERLRREKAGQLPTTPINVIRKENRVIFQACSNKELLQSAWEFLERQGVRWLFPGPQGDYLQPGKGVDLSVLPIHYTPSSQWIHRNFDFTPTKMKGLQASRDADLFFWRNRYDSTWGNRQNPVLGADPTTRSAYILSTWNVKPAPNTTVVDDYIEGFTGFPHNFLSALPGKIFNRNRSWQKMHRDPKWLKQNSKIELGKRAGWEGCFSNPGITEFFYHKIKAIVGANKAEPQIIWLLPMDCVKGCECEKCMALNAAGMGVTSLEWPDRPGNFQSSGSFYTMVLDLAKRIKPELPNVKIGILPYGFVQAPPKNIGKFPDNVVADLCLGQHQGRNLPMDSPGNDALRERVIAWHDKLPHGQMMHYDYVLLASKDEKAPVPLVNAIVSRAKFYQKYGLLEGGTQGNTETLLHNPWNFYAYPRIYWNVNQSSEELLREFFNGYYREAAKPMLEYYKCVEDYQHKNNLSSGALRPSAEIPGMFPYSLLKTMDKALAEAEKQAKSWVVRRRVETARAGFNSILAIHKLTARDLASAQSFPVVSKDAVLNLPGKTLKSLWGFGSPDKASGTFKFQAQGAAVAYLNVKTPGNYRVQVEAKSNGFDNIWPVITCTLDAEEVSSITVDSTTDKPYPLDITITKPGIHTLTMTYRNAALGGKRNLIIKRLQVK